VVCARLIAGALFASGVFAQLLPPGTPVPRTSKPPVVFMNGFQSLCATESFSGTFGNADQILQANGEASMFFDTCNQPQTASIEDLGVAFGNFLASWKFTDGQPVTQFDVVAHSLGGLVLRSYLAGKQNSSGAFQPPGVTHIRKAIFLATPHFGSGLGLLLGVTGQAQESASGSQFLFDLGTWNQGTDDLRGIDAIAVIGNGGTGRTVMPGFDDGVVALTSASLRFYQPGRTRILPLCHVGGGGLVGFAGLCNSNARGIANMQSASDDNARIVVSFLNGTDDWKSIGTAAENDPFLSVDGGLIVALHSAGDVALEPSSVTANSASGASKQLNIPSDTVAYTDLFPAGSMTLSAVSGSVSVKTSLTLPAGGVSPFTLKPGPEIARVLPAASNVFPLSVAPGMFIAIYGASLAAQTAQAPGLPFPNQLADVQVLVSGAPIPLYFVSAAQIDAVLPDNISGLVKLTIRNSAGSHTVNLLAEAAVPAIFTQNASGFGPAAALNAKDSSLVTAANPLHAGDSVELFATGLGLTTNRSGLDFANQQPTVSIGGANCPVTFAGRAPGYIGLDQINCVVPAGITAGDAVPVTITSGSRVSNVATLALR
jgi:uncharacterized protein (TIGR03437 family)